ncbi:DUF4153 domain-containing protein [Xanthomonas sp. LMC-A-07]|uniref:DUF4153 domain-containing protein n=1 Tax=Xanthomonas sp. LMC-A-07 TaxID=3040329 RepID=UPI00255562B1|nr:DUF4153 domain-containing protein [Xanthomonas sp. LMC-A-07]
MLPTSALHPASDDLPLPRQTRAFIVLVALLQGGLLYLAEWGADHGVAPFAALGGRVCWYTLILTVPSMLLLSVQTLHDRRLWQQLAVVAAVFAALAGWAAWSATGAPGLESNKVLTPFGLSVAAALLIALPWLQFRQHHGSWRASYHALFEHAWQNTLTLALALVFVGVCWGVLTLWAELFALVKIDLFRTLFREDAFIYLATGTMAGLGILIGRTRQRAVQVMRQIVFALCTGLVPLLASIALLFILTLPLTGLQPLWQTRAAAAILLCMVFGLVLFTNAVYQDGATPPAYPGWLRRVVEAGLLTLPLYAGLAFYAVGVRIAQYGWTGERFWGVVLAAVASAYAVGYAIAVLRPRPGQWLAPLARSNKMLSWVVIALLLLVNTPVLDPYRIVVASQLQQLAQRGGTANPDLLQDDLEFLRFANGRRGYHAVQALRDTPVFANDAKRSRQLTLLLGRTQRWQEPQSDDALRRTRMHDAAELQAHLLLAAGSSSPDPTWWSALAQGSLHNDSCLQRDADCVITRRDLDQDGQDEVMLCDLSGKFGVTCTLYTRDAQGWYRVDTLNSFPQRSQQQEALREAVRQGKLATLPRRWPDLLFPGGKPMGINSSANARKTTETP